jgi:hypothetical protein
MYLFHETTDNSLLKILKSKMLKSNEHTKIKNYGQGIYKTSPFVFFNTCVDINDVQLQGYSPKLFFNSKLLYDGTFWTNKTHISFPSKESNSKKYSKHYTNINLILRRLYKQSIKIIKNGYVYQAFQQIAIKRNINIDNNFCAIWLGQNPNKKVINILENYYPDVEIINTHKDFKNYNKKKDIYFNKKRTHPT